MGRNAQRRRELRNALAASAAGTTHQVKRAAPEHPRAGARRLYTSPHFLPSMLAGMAMMGVKR
ncbi:MAG TPA: hypothetical protein PK280_20120 [Planctomycetota bacterium]|nr:hypothetical protein [Planctomycetota bacterium]